jgi:hypothetical protein
MCRIPIQSLAAVLLLAASASAALMPWTPANFRGLTLGSAHRAQAISTLGTPDAAQHTSAGEELTYHARGDHKGDLTVHLDRAGVITEIEEAFPVAIPRTEIYKEFGKSALTGHYSQAKCAAGALYRDPRGGVELTLFPARGIALWPDQYGYDFAALHYFAHPPGLPHAPACVGRH